MHHCKGLGAPASCAAIRQRHARGRHDGRVPSRATPGVGAWADSDSAAGCRGGLFQGRTATARRCLYRIKHWQWPQRGTGRAATRCHILSDSSHCRPPPPACSYNAYCPDKYREWSYREPRVLAELSACGAAVVCLQEVDESFFHGALSAWMREHGYQGWFRPRPVRPPCMPATTTTTIGSRSAMSRGCEARGDYPCVRAAACCCCETGSSRCHGGCRWAPCPAHQRAWRCWCGVTRSRWWARRTPLTSWASRHLPQGSRQRSQAGARHAAPAAPQL